MTVRFDTAYGFKPDIGAYGGTDSRINRTSAVRLNDIVNVKDFGALGDGATDDTAAIDDAIDYAWERGTFAGGNQGGAIIYFPAGTYRIGTPPLRLDRSSGDGKTHRGFIRYIGAGRDISILTGNYDTGGLALEEDNAGFLCKAGFGGMIPVGGSDLGACISTLEHLSIINTSAVLNSGALQVFVSGNNLLMINCHFRGYIGVAHSSNVFVAAMRNCKFTCSVGYSGASAATRTPFYDIAKFAPPTEANIVTGSTGITKINSTTARVTTTAAHGLPSGTSRLALQRLQPVDWEPGGDGSGMVSATVTSTTQFTYELLTTPSGVFTGTYPGDPNAFIQQSNNSGSVGLYGSATTLINCTFEGFDAGLCINDNSCTMFGCKFYRCGTGILCGFIGGSPKGISEGSTVRPQVSYYRGVNSSSWSACKFDRCSIGIHFRGAGALVGRALYVSGPSGPWEPVAITNITTDTTTATVTTTTHNLVSGNTKLHLVVSPASWTPDGTGAEVVTVTRTGTTTFTYPLSGSKPTFASGTWNYTPDYGFGFNGVTHTTHYSYTIDTPTNLGGFSCWYVPVGYSPASLLLHVVGVYNNLAVGMMGTTWVRPEGDPNPGGLQTCGWRFIKCGNATAPYPGIWCDFNHRPGGGSGGEATGPYIGQIFTFTNCATQSSFAGTISGTGANHYKVRYDGTNWTRIG